MYDTLCVIARHEAIQTKDYTLDCFVVPPRNDTKATTEQLNN